MSKNTKVSAKTPMTQTAVSRIMSASAKNNQGAYSGERDRSFWSIVTAAHAMLLRG